MRSREFKMFRKNKKNEFFFCALKPASFDGKWNLFSFYERWKHWYFPIFRSIYQKQKSSKLSTAEENFRKISVFYFFKPICWRNLPLKQRCKFMFYRLRYFASAISKQSGLNKPDGVSDFPALSWIVSLSTQANGSSTILRRSDAVRN